MRRKSSPQNFGCFSLLTLLSTVYLFFILILKVDVRLIPYNVDSSYLTTVSTPASISTVKFPVLRIMSGKCNYRVMDGTLATSCLCDEFTGTSKDGQLDIVCQGCHHPLTQHGDASPAEIGSSEQEQVPELSSHISPRSETVSKLMKTDRSLHSFLPN